MAELIEIQGPDGTAEAYLGRSRGASRGGLLFYADVFGLRPRIADMVDRIASWGYTVLAPNVFYRLAPAEKLAPESDLRVQENRDAFVADRGRDRIASLTPDLLAKDVPGYAAVLADYTGDLPIATVGYCMGARLAVRTAGLLPERVAGVAGFHGGGLVTDAPDSPHAAIAGTSAHYLFRHADGDAAMPPEDIAELDRTLAAAGVSYSNRVYTGAPHGYSMEDTASWEPDSGERHFAELREMLEATL